MRDKGMRGRPYVWNGGEVYECSGFIERVLQRLEDDKEEEN